MLAIDTCGPFCAAAVFSGEPLPGNALSQRTEPMARGHAERIVPMIGQCLDEAKLKITDLDLIAVTVGPGSFTGVRIGVATARGLALTGKVQAIGVITLEARAHAIANLGSTATGFALTQDARRGQVYHQAFDIGGCPISAPEILDETDPRVSAATDVTGEPLDLWALASVAVSKRGSVTEAPKPLYLRPPDAKPQVGKALQRQ
ncbi:MAG: tRNA (adenosine(37)-N6)-threonylcarbamoyltransferase complex dimerization subunit type 1 TsaB [Pseudomonadota bacterium]